MRSSRSRSPSGRRASFGSGSGAGSIAALARRRRAPASPSAPGRSLAPRARASGPGSRPSTGSAGACSPRIRWPLAWTRASASSTSSRPHRLGERAFAAALEEVVEAGDDAAARFAAGFHPPRLRDAVRAAHERLRSQGVDPPRLPDPGAPVRSVKDEGRDARADSGRGRRWPPTASRRCGALLDAYHRHYERLKAERSGRRLRGPRAARARAAASARAGARRRGGSASST